MAEHVIFVGARRVARCLMGLQLEGEVMIAHTLSWAALPSHVRHCVPQWIRPEELIAPSGVTANQIIKRCSEVIPKLHDLHCPPMSPKDLLCLLGEALASVHFVIPSKGIKDLDISGIAASAAIHCTFLTIAANVEYARHAGLLRTILLPGEYDHGMAVLNEIHDWEIGPRRLAYERRHEDARSARIDWCVNDLVQRTYNPDYEASVRAMERVLVDHAGGNEGLASSRERLGRSRRERASITASYARMLIARGRNVWDYSGDRVVIDPSKMRQGLDEMFERGAPRKSGSSEWVDSGELGGPKRKRRALLSLDGMEITDSSSIAERDQRLALEELREARDYFEQRNERLMAEALQSLSTKARDEDFSVLTHCAKRLVGELHGLPAALRAAVVYEFLGREYSQEQVAAEYRVSRYELQAQLAQAERLLQRVSAA